MASVGKRRAIADEHFAETASLGKDAVFPFDADESPDQTSGCRVVASPSNTSTDFESDGSVGSVASSKVDMDDIGAAVEFWSPCRRPLDPGKAARIKERLRHFDRASHHILQDLRSGGQHPAYGGGRRASDPQVLSSIHDERVHTEVRRRSSSFSGMLEQVPELRALDGETSTRCGPRLSEANVAGFAEQQSAASDSASSHEGMLMEPRRRGSTSSEATSSAQWQVPSSVVILLDWDDTLFPTSWLLEKGWFRNWAERMDERLPSVPAEDARLLSELESAARSFVLAASQLGKVSCVTLSGRPWPLRSMEAFMPRLLETWKSSGIDIRYAREEKIHRAGSRAEAWRLTSTESAERTQLEEDMYMEMKQMSMHKILKEHYKFQSWKNVLSFGDGYAEQLALQEIGVTHTNLVSSTTGQQKDFRVKTVKMLFLPTCQQLAAELEMLQAWLPALVHANRDFHVSFDNTETDLLATHNEIMELAVSKPGDTESDLDDDLSDGSLND
eukprot:TRINITY_DN24009_c1_g3_i1.p1 TRINITY_DN24009_c1_g3~~TRINITY_DN24009_c1_g3_i1.p1  ORF type:complete len:502 (-),score=78.90 TRINITY_DN24009_c1_g3_i1:193-1698(-)